MKKYIMTIRIPSIQDNNEAPTTMLFSVCHYISNLVLMGLSCLTNPTKKFRDVTSPVNIVKSFASQINLSLLLGRPI
jgi:hypothetical protein